MTENYDQLTNKILTTTKELINIKSISKNINEIKKIIDYVKKFYENSDLTITEFKNKGIISLLIGNIDSKIMLHGHLDVVPAPDELFKTRVEDNKLFGRGSNDMKAAVATMMHLMKDEKPNNVNLLLTTDEEIGGYNGTKYVLDILQNKPEFFISGEPTGLKIGNQAKGILVIKLISRGKTAHSARIWEGDNAIKKMMHVIHDLEELFPKKGDYYTTINYGVIKGGDVSNKVPDYCELEVDIRYVPNTDVEELKKKISELSEIKILHEEEIAYCEPNNKYITKLVESLKKKCLPAELINKHTASDARHATKYDISSIVFGPVGYGSHTPEEHVKIDSLKKYHDVLKEFTQSLRK